MRKVDSDSEFNPDGTLKDHHAMQVSLSMMDSCTLLDDGDPELRITDAKGSMEGLHRPGWRIEHIDGQGGKLLRDHERAERNRLYDLYDAELSQEHRRRGPPTQDAAIHRHIDNLNDPRAVARANYLDELENA